MLEHGRENLLRLVAAGGLSVKAVAEACGLDQRTISGILAGSKKPHAQTLHRLAEGLRVSIDEFFIDPAGLLYRRFDQQTNPVVADVVEARSELFAGWTQADFDELHSRVGTGGPLTFEGTLAAVDQMNQKRQLHEKLDLVLESSHAELAAGLIELLWQRVKVLPG